MSLDYLIWIALPLLVAGGTALLTYVLMKDRLDVALAQERQIAHEAKLLLASARENVEDRVRAAEETARRRSFDEFLNDFHVEERRYARDTKGLFLQKQSMIIEERLWFRNIPLSGWVQHEVQVDSFGRPLAPPPRVFEAPMLDEPPPKRLINGAGHAA